MDWQPIETAPQFEPVFVYGYTVRGQASPGGPYKRWEIIIGEVDDIGRATDVERPGCDCIRGRELDKALCWMAIPWPDPPARGIEAAEAGETA